MHSPLSLNDLSDKSACHNNQDLSRGEIVNNTKSINSIISILAGIAALDCPVLLLPFSQGMGLRGCYPFHLATNAAITLLASPNCIM